MASTPKELKMFNIAKNFWMGAQRCAERRPSSNGTFEMPILPTIFCYAFASEMLLKLLITISGLRYKEIHNLKNLAKTLPQDIRSKIESEYTKRSGKDANVLERELAAMATTVVDWRYLDKPTIDTDLNALRQVAESLFGVVAQLRPDLTV